MKKIKVKHDNKDRIICVTNFGPRIKGAYAEVISHNKKNFARELQSGDRQHNRQQNRTKRNGGRKKFNVNFIVKISVFLYN